jgi:PAS domain S-box-containing protein
MVTKAETLTTTPPNLVNIMTRAALAVSSDKESIFRELVFQIAEIMGVEYAFIGELLGEENQEIRVIASYLNGEYDEGYQYSMANTPCEKVINRGYQYYRDNVRILFSDPHAHELEVEGYAAIPLINSNNKPIGLMVIMDRKPLVNPELCKSLLMIFSVRAAVELERLESKRAAEEKTEQFMTFFNNSVDGVCLFDDTGKVLDANPAWKTIHGYAATHDFSNINPMEFIPPESHHLFPQFVNAVRETGHVHIEAMGQKRDGTRMNVDIHGVRMSHLGRPALMAILRDVTHHKEAVKEIRIKEEQYAAVFNTTSDGMALWTTKGELVDVNPACCALHGMNKEELLQAELTEFVPPESMPILMNLMANVRQGRSYKDEAIATHKDGRIFNLDVRGEPVTFRGEPHILLIIRDISEQKQREEDLRRSEDLFRATVEAALDCIVSMDEQGRIIEFNPAAEKTFGYRREEVVGQLLAEMIIPDGYREAHSKGMQRYLSNKKGPYLGQRIEIEAMRSDGSTFPVELAIDVAQAAEGKVFIGYIRDITEQKRAEEEQIRLEAQLRQSQKMEAIGHLTGGIAHDFNNILTGVMGYVVMAQEWEEKHPDSKLKRYLDRASNSGKRARDLIQQMLTFSRGQRGEPRPLQLAPLAKETIKMLESTLPSTMEIRFEASNNLPMVTMDPVHVEQILMNLCINARDAMDGNGALDISVQQVECTTPCICASCRDSLSGHYLQVSVKDNGMGITRENIDRIFEPFFSTKEVGKGSGMGLSTVHGIVHEYNGHIVVQSEPGQGAKFCVMLPVEAGSGTGEVATLEEKTTIHADSSLAGEVLLVDDDETVREYMQDRLEDWGLSVTSHTNGITALTHLEQRDQAYDLCILDYTMPKMNGLTLAEKILKRWPETKVILYSGYSEHLSEEDVIAKGVRALVRKPVEVESFHTLLTEQLT